MYPYQQAQPGYPTQQNPHNGGFNNIPQPYGGTMPMPGLPIVGSGPAPQTGFGNTPGYSNPGYPSQGYPQPNPTQCYPSQPNPAQGYPSQYPQVAANAGYPQGTLGYTPGNQSYPQPNQYQGYPSTSHLDAQHNQAYSMSSNPVPKSKPTVVPARQFDPRNDAAILRKAMKGFGTDEKAIIEVLTRRTNEERLRIVFEYKTLYGKDLVSDLKSETSGKFEDLLVALMTPLPQYYAKELHDAIAGIGTDEDVLIEVMCTVTNREIHAIKQAYTTTYGRSLEDDLRGDTSGYFKKFMTSLCMGNRAEDFYVDKVKAKEDAKSLRKAGELRLGTDESTFNAIFCSRSFPQLAAIFEEYHLQQGSDIENAIKSEFSGDLEKALRTIVKVARSKAVYIAELLHKSMKGLGTNDRQLIRIMVTRCEVDLGDISDMFQKKYGKTLRSWIEGDCSGHYKKCLLGLLGQQ